MPSNRVVTASTWLFLSPLKCATLIRILILALR
ncbi:Uncharacterised protein [Klebsiella pneumoniae]|nr:Uncharacterised protein [Klebsiella pneumoniae]